MRHAIPLLALLCAIGCGDDVETASAPIRVHAATPVGPSIGAPRFEHVETGAGLGDELLGPEQFEGWVRNDLGDPHEGQSIRSEAPYHHVQIIGVLTDEGASRLERLSAERIGERIAVTVDGRLTSAPVIRDRLRSGRVVIFEGRDSEARPIEDALSGR